MMLAATAVGTGNPFPGLRPFREDEEHLFFGRERQVDAMIDKLADTRFLAVVGVSGSGKSSLVNCGLRPALHRGLMSTAGTVWRIAQFRPGNNPMRAMADALAQDGLLYAGPTQGRFRRSDLIETTLRLSKAGLLDVYEQARLTGDTNLLVVVDQFEELFRYRALAAPRAGGPSGSEEATAFVNLLLEPRDQHAMPVYVALTMRSDFLGDCAQFFGLPEAINKGQYLVPRLTRDDRRLAIVGPIGIAGAQIAPVLLTRLVNDVGDNPDQLSILQHALNRTWRRWQTAGRRDEPIDLPHYEAIGTMANALDQHAEEAYGELGTDRQRTVCEKLFKALTDTTTDARGIRRPTRVDTLCALTGASAAELTAVIDVFREPSRAFLMPPVGEPLGADTVVDISHESLMRAWTRLRQWAVEEAQSAQMYRRLAETAALHAAGESSLWRDPDLQLAINWHRRNRPDARWAEQYRPGFDLAMQFLQASEAARDAERRAVRRTRTILLAAVGVALVVMAALGARMLRDRDRAAQASEILAIEKRERQAAEEARDRAREAERVAVERTSALLAQFGWDNRNLTRSGYNQADVGQSLTANELLQKTPRVGRERRRSITVEYFPKNVDGNKVEAALTELGFTVRKPAAIVSSISTNAVWFGSPVDVEDVKLVALTLIRAGVQIRAIRPIQDYIVNKRDLPLIQVGADASILNDPPLSVAAIQSASRFSR
jgi:hypothetical protein